MRNATAEKLLCLTAISGRAILASLAIPSGLQLAALGTELNGKNLQYLSESSYIRKDIKTMKMVVDLIATLVACMAAPKAAAEAVNEAERPEDVNAGRILK